MSAILAGSTTAGPEPGGDAGVTDEALSSVARTLRFRLTVRDNAPYKSTAPVSVGQTQFTNVVVTVALTTGAFAVSSPNTGVTWVGGSSHAINWSVSGTTAAPFNCANVKISMSTDGGQSFPIILAASTPNDGTETFTIPNFPTNTARIKVESIGNIFFDISNANFTITPDCNVTPVLYVDSAMTTAGNGASWPTAFNSLQQALTLANNCSTVKEIRVKKGTYYPGQSVRETSFGIYRNNLKIYGGFSDTDTTISTRKPIQNPTILSGEIGNSSQVADNSYHVLLIVAATNRNIDSTTIVDGFTITGGNANSALNFTAGGKTLNHNRGAGIYCFADSGNNCSPDITGCLFTKNSASRTGGGLYNEGGTTGNSSPRITNCVFYSNTAGVIAGIPNGGGGIYNNAIQGTANPSIINCTFAFNNASNGTGGAIHNNAGNIANISNCIIFGNVANAATDNIVNDGGTINITYSLVESGYAGTGNIDGNPNFVNAETGDLNLMQCSAATNAGDSSLFPAGIITDITGKPRIFNATIDMGAYENTNFPTIFTFKGSGVWSNFRNWLCNWLPPTTLPSGSQVNIDPLTGDCIQDIPFTVGAGATLTIKPGKHLIVPGNVTID